MKYTVEKLANRKDWLAARRRGIGASDSAAILGYSGFRSPFAIYTDKVCDDVDNSEDAILEWGRRLEPAVARAFEDATGLPLHDPGDFTIYRSVSHPWIYATLDRQAGVEAVPLELKVNFHGNANDWKQSIPMAYKIQLQHQLFVTGADFGYFAVLHVGTPLFRWYTVQRHEKFINRMVAKITHFWQEHVEAKQMPPVDYADSTRLAIQRLWPTHKEKTLEVYDPELIEAAESFDAAQEAISEAEKRKAAAANRIRVAMEDAAYLALPSGDGFSWKSARNGNRTLLRKKKVRLENEQ